MQARDDYLSLTIAEMKAALRQFDERVNAALAAAPPSKDRVKQSLHRAGDGRCPVWIKRLSPDIALRYGDDLADLFCRWPDDVVRVVPYDLWVGYQPPDRPPRIDPVEIVMRDAEWEDEWGTRWGHSSGGVAPHRSLIRSRTGRNWTTTWPTGFPIRTHRDGWPREPRRCGSLARRVTAWASSTWPCSNGCTPCAA